MDNWGTKREFGQQDSLISGASSEKRRDSYY